VTDTAASAMAVGVAIAPGDDGVISLASRPSGVIEFGPGGAGMPRDAAEQAQDRTGSMMQTHSGGGGGGGGPGGGERRPREPAARPWLALLPRHCVAVHTERRGPPYRAPQRHPARVSSCHHHAQGPPDTRGQERASRRSRVAPAFPPCDAQCGKLEDPYAWSSSSSSSSLFPLVSSCLLSMSSHPASRLRRGGRPGRARGR
jgi:hypothetical protein